MASAAANFAKKMSALRVEADEQQARAEDLATKIKTLEQDNLAKEQEIKSLAHRNGVLESEVEKLENNLKGAKEEAVGGAQHGEQNESLKRRLQLLEDEAETADKTLRETNDKLRQTDVKAGHYERKVQALEAERDSWETKFEDMSKKYTELKQELQELEVSMGNI